MAWTIYRHTFPNGKIYIGQTKVSLKKRFKNGAGYVGCPLIERAINKYGWENVITDILESNISDSEKANEQEKYYIALYDACNPEVGYNIAIGGGIVNRANYEEIYNEWLNNLGVNAIARKLGYDRNTVAKALESYGVSKEERLNRTPQSISQASKIFDRLAIYQAWKSNPNFQLIREQFNCSEDTLRRVLDEYGVSIKERRLAIKRRLDLSPTGYNKKKINQYDLNDNFIQSFNSIADANRSLGKAPNASNIVLVCKGKRNQAYGFKWKYADEKIL